MDIKFTSFKTLKPISASTQHSSLAGTRREHSVKYTAFGGSSYSNYFKDVWRKSFSCAMRYE
uniref:Ovule protein n=1 Tax=Heterorhabditis bacteriophora TaxID=37862 RepID=A0A1I7WYT4_HETBA